jgi:alpha-ketoglutarate-dependent 2,4-dichlorophenoxyacetate dioxygenase
VAGKSLRSLVRPTPYLYSRTFFTRDDSASHAYAVEGMEAAAGKKLIDELMEATTQAATSYLHQWREGDVVMWDNRATMHRGPPWPAREPRVMVRATISATAADGVDTMRSPSMQAAAAE